jgi:hypothetical protein
MRENEIQRRRRKMPVSLRIPSEKKMKSLRKRLPKAERRRQPISLMPWMKS